MCSCVRTACVVTGQCVSGRLMEELWKREVISFVNRINNGEEWQRRLELEWEQRGMRGDVVASDITAPPMYVANNMELNDAAKTYRHKPSLKIIKSKIRHGETCANSDENREYHVAKELVRGAGESEGQESTSSGEGAGRSEQEGHQPSEWEPQELFSLLATIGAARLVPPHPKRKELLRTARNNWARGRHVHGVEEMNDTNPEAWLNENFKVDFGDGSAKEVLRFLSLQTMTRHGTRAAGKRKPGLSASKRVDEADKSTAKPKKGWNVGTGVHCMSNQERDTAVRVPPSSLSRYPTIAVGEGLAILVSWVQSYLQDKDKQRSVYFGDANFWINWLLRDFRFWVQRLPKDGIGKFGEIKMLLALLVLLMAEGPAVVKVKGHAGSAGNIKADALANIGRERSMGDWSILDGIDWNKLKDFLIEASTGDGAEPVPHEKQKQPKQGSGHMLRWERVCEMHMRKARVRLLPKLHSILEQAKQEWSNRESDQRGFEVMQRRYKEASESIFQGCAQLIGTRPDSGSGSQQVRHTKEYREKSKRTTNIARVLREVREKRHKGARVKHELAEKLLVYADCIETSVSGEAQWKNLLQFAKEKLSLEQEELEDEDMTDRAVARKRNLYAASMRGDFRCLKSILKPKEVVEVMVSPQDFAVHTANLSEPPPGWIDQGVHLEDATQLRERFGPPPGAFNEEADIRMLRVVLREEVIRAWKGKKKASKAGSDGIPYCVRAGLVVREDEDFLSDTADLDTFFIKVAREALQTFTDWKTVRDWILPKGGKEDYSVPKSYRNISCSVVPAKSLGFIYWARMSEWLQMTGRGGNFQVFGKRKGFPGATYAIKMLTTILTTAEHYKLNVLFIMLDLDSFYPRLVKWVIFVALTWLGIPDQGIREFMAFIGDKEAVLTKGAEILAKYSLVGVPQGCSSSVMMMVVVTIVLGQQVTLAGKGFLFPEEHERSEEDKWWGGSTNEYRGAAYADDIFAPTGGGRSVKDRMPPEEVIANIKVINEKLMQALRALCLPVGLTKTIVTGLMFDDKGARYHPTVELEVFSEQGEASIHYSPLEDIMPHLGIIHSNPDEEHLQLSAIQIEQEAHIMQMVSDPDLHPKMLLDMWFISAMGKWKYVVSKLDLPDEAPADADKMSKRVVRCIMKIHNLPAPCMHAAHENFGLGLPDLGEFKVLSATHAVCSLAFSKDTIATEFFWTYMSMTRRINGIGAKADPEDFTFFDWDVDSLTDRQIKKWKWHNDLVLVLKMCRERDLQFTLTRNAITMEQVEWCMKGSAKAEKSIRTHEEIVIVNKAVGIVRGWKKRKYAIELKLIPGAGTLARSSRADRIMSNAWKKVGTIQLGEWDFQVKATYRMLVSPAMRHRFDKSVSPACALCSCTYANQKHILSCCDNLKSRQYTWRHNQVLTQVKKVLRKRWQIISTEQDAIKRWIPKGIHVETRATKPDLTLLNETAGKGVLVAIVDVAVAYDEDDNLENAEYRKIEKYAPIKEAIQERAKREQWGDNVKVEIVPLVVGTLGVVQKSWSTHMETLLVPRNEAEALGKVVSVEAIKASNWIWQQYNKLTRSAQTH